MYVCDILLLITPSTLSCMMRRAGPITWKPRWALSEGFFLALWPESIRIRSAHGIFGFPRLLYSPRYLQGGWWVCRLPSPPCNNHIRQIQPVGTLLHALKGQTLDAFNLGWRLPLRIFLDRKTYKKHKIHTTRIRQPTLSYHSNCCSFSLVSQMTKFTCPGQAGPVFRLDR